MTINQSLRCLVIFTAGSSALISLPPAFAQPTTHKNRQSSTKNERSVSDVQSLRVENRRLREELEALKKAVARLQSEIETRGLFDIPRGITIEYGSLLFEKGRKHHWKKIKFRNKYRAPPIVLVCESGTSGNWVVVKSEGITKTQADIAVQGKFEYQCRIGYLVVGEGESIAAPPPPEAPSMGADQNDNGTADKLDEEARKAIFQKIRQSQYRATIEADARYPAPDPVSPRWTLAQDKEQGARRRNLERSLERKYLDALARECRLPLKRLREIELEGEINGWPEPPWPEDSMPGLGQP